MYYRDLFNEVNRVISPDVGSQELGVRLLLSASEVVVWAQRKSFYATASVGMACSLSSMYSLAWIACFSALLLINLDGVRGSDNPWMAVGSYKKPERWYGTIILEGAFCAPY